MLEEVGCLCVDLEDLVPTEEVGVEAINHRNKCIPTDYDPFGARGLASTRPRSPRLGHALHLRASS